MTSKVWFITGSSRSLSIVHPVDVATWRFSSATLLPFSATNLILGPCTQSIHRQKRFTPSPYSPKKSGDESRDGETLSLKQLYPTARNLWSLVLVCRNHRWTGAPSCSMATRMGRRTCGQEGRKGSISGNGVVGCSSARPALACDTTGYRCQTMAVSSEMRHYWSTLLANAADPFDTPTKCGLRIAEWGSTALVCCPLITWK